jgi:hypothetical protein
MVVSAHFGNLRKMRYMEHDSPSEENKSGCAPANLLSQSLAVYVELEIPIGPLASALNQPSVRNVNLRLP